MMSKLRAQSNRLCALQDILSLLQWDQEVMMPDQGVKDRANQVAVLKAIIHRMVVSSELEKLLKSAEEQKDRLSVVDQALLRVMRREHDKNTKLPEKFVSDFSHLTASALPVWVEARRQSDFTLFAPFLQKIVTMCRQKAEYLGYVEEPYDALLDLHEEGLLTKTANRIFFHLKPILTEMIGKYRSSARPLIVFQSDLDHEKQIAFSDKILKTIGFDCKRGRHDESVHPFSARMGHNDQRITNRYNPRSFEFIFSALHEGGHALYEQGTDQSLAESHLDTGISLGIHESQSRFWENIIGRSRPFWSKLFPELKKTFPEHLSQLSLDAFLSEINAVRPGLIRVEADEISYNLHILIRFELEKELIEGNIAVQDLPSLWNEMYRNYLDLDIPDSADADADGVLQDIHWAHGSFGYFPTYTIGNLAAAQFWNAYCRFDPDCEQALNTCHFTQIRNWLEENIWRHGSLYTPETLINKATGERLTEKYFLQYLKNKFESHL